MSSSISNENLTQDEVFLSQLLESKKFDLQRRDASKLQLLSQIKALGEQEKRNVFSFLFAKPKVLLFSAFLIAVLIVGSISFPLINQPQKDYENLNFDTATLSSYKTGDDLINDLTKSMDKRFEATTADSVSPDFGESEVTN